MRLKACRPALQETGVAVAETIANNVRSKIIKEHLNDPAFYDKMLALLKEILDDLRARRIDYAEFLKRMSAVVTQVQQGKGDDTPKQLDTPGKRALYNLLVSESPLSGAHAHENSSGYLGVVPGSALDLALKIDLMVKERRPDGWRGIVTKERMVKGLIHQVVPDEQRVEQLFLIIKAQSEY